MLPSVDSSFGAAAARIAPASAITTRSLAAVKLERLARRGGRLERPIAQVEDLARARATRHPGRSARRWARGAPRLRGRAPRRSSWRPRRASSRARTPRQIAWVEQVLAGRGALGDLAERLGVLIAALLVERLREHRGGGGEQRALAHRPEPVEVGLEPRLRPPPGRRPASRPAPRGGRPPSAGGRARRGSRWPRRSAGEPRRSRRSGRAAAPAGAASRPPRPGCRATCSRDRLAATGSPRRPASGRTRRPSCDQPRISTQLAVVAGATRVLRRLAARPRRRPRTGSRSTRSSARRRQRPAQADGRRASAPQRRVGGAARAASVPAPGSAWRRTSSRSTLRARLRARVARGAGALDRLGERALGVRRAAPRRRGRRRARAAARGGGSRRQQRGGALQQRRRPRPGRRAAARRGRRSRGAAPPRAASARSSPATAELGCGSGTPARGGSRRSRPAAPRLGLEPAGEALVQVGAPPLRQPAVGDVADQRMGEAEGVLARVLGQVGLDQLPARERDQRRAEARPSPQQRGERRRGGRSGPRPTRARAARARPARAVEARGEHGLDASAGASSPAAAPIATSCSRNSGLPSARVDDARAAAPARAAAASATSARASASASASSPSTDALRCGAAQAGRARAAPGAPRQSEQDRRPAREARRRSRADRAAPARPSGRHRRRRRAAARAPTASNSRRTAQAVSSGWAASSERPIAPRIRRRERQLVAGEHARRRVVAELADDLGERRGTRCPRRSVRQRPVTTVASSPAAATASRARRDLPMPGGPTTRDEPRSLLAPARARARRAARASSARAPDERGGRRPRLERRRASASPAAATAPAPSGSARRPAPDRAPAAPARRAGPRPARGRRGVERVAGGDDRGAPGREDLARVDAGRRRTPRPCSTLDARTGCAARRSARSRRARPAARRPRAAPRARRRRRRLSPDEALDACRRGAR